MKFTEAWMRSINEHEGHLWCDKIVAALHAIKIANKEEAKKNKRAWREQY